MSKKVLLIDDEKLIIESITSILSEWDIDVTGVSSSPEGLNLALSRDFDLIITDLRMPELNGAELTQRVMEKKPNSQILIISAYVTDPLAHEALESGAKTIIGKPFEIGKILNFLEVLDEE